jgi:hypothetical protein
MARPMAIDPVTPAAIKEPEIELCKDSNFGLFMVSCCANKLAYYSVREKTVKPLPRHRVSLNHQFKCVLAYYVLPVQFHLTICN